MNNHPKFIAIVTNGTFEPLWSNLAPDEPKPGIIRLTGIDMQMAQSPESAEIDVKKYEGSAIMVQGHPGGEWLYSAHVIDEAGPILTAVVEHLFKKKLAL